MENIEQHTQFMAMFIEDINTLVANLLEGLRKEYHISIEQSQALFLLDNNKSLTLSEITEKQGVNKAAISRRIKKLINLELVELVKQNENVDQRLKYVKLTNNGREYIERTKVIVNDVSTYLLQDLSQTQIEETAENLKIIDQRIKEYISKNR
ncbi:MarR family winged helix-turn-helix transcriptional regulator [Staphylococcus simulans]|uniref:MarR family winged helix-turn-helix transcriptional regulator n=1 Tax=Staphylococcus simulans TaxID=1286 RepID=UPI000D1D65B3|nr:MarR family transcriptional regulator [Staphylococcus simulans]MDY5061161.1 MarR family transcriptional regulator [Staphylococcus simulans]PTJ19602.1 MarR family transcriptional regulator [Staphylococcus simulans]RIN78276.1 MarR family transcriptional regulator [Staphylococcus simulans]